MALQRKYLLALEETLYNRIQEQSDKERRSIASIIREALIQYYSADTTQ